MYAYLKGVLAEIYPTEVVLECGPLGYKIALPAQSLSRLPSLGEPLKLFTSFVIRENSQALYGFLTSGERDLFEALITVSGIGPKIGLSLLGHLSPDQLLGAITRSDLHLLSKVPGIGKKTAERLVMELRDKLSLLGAASLQTPSLAAFSPEDQKLQDALSALINLGYQQATAQKALQKTLKETEASADLGTLITTSLKYL